MIKKCLFSLFVLLFLPVGLLFCSSDVEDSGTIIVTYKTDSKGERLDRIRFWLKREGDLKRVMYPKGMTYVDDPEGPSRMVVIEEIPEGKYSLQFLVPNKDNYFAEVTDREVVVTPGDVVKVNQQIKPLKNKDKYSKPIAKKPVQKPPVIVKKEEVSQEFGKLIISYELKSPELATSDITVKLVNDRGVESIHPIAGRDTEVPLKSGKMMMLPQVEEGIYTLEFFARDKEDTPVHSIKEVKVDPKKTKSVHASLVWEVVEDREEVVQEEDEEEKPNEEEADIALLELSVAANIPTALYSLKNADGTVSLKGEGRVHRFEGLVPGNYLLSFESSDPFFVPPAPQTIQLSNEVEEIESLFETLGKIKILTNVKEAEGEVASLHNLNEKTPFTITDGVGDIYLPEGDYRLTFKSTGQHATPHPVDVSVHSLRSKEVNVYFERNRNKR